TTLNDDLAHCPAALKQLAQVPAFDDLPADTGLIDAYSSPDNSQVLLVRHLWRSLPNCAAELSPAAGADRLSLMTAGIEKAIMDVPANDRAPLYLDRFTYTQPVAGT